MILILQIVLFRVYCFCSVTQLWRILCDPAALHASLSLPISWSLPKFISIALVMPTSHLILWCPLHILHSIFPSIRIFSNESAVHIRWAKYWSSSFSISPSNEYSGWISLKFELFDLCCSRDSQESYPEPQFEGIDSFLFFLLYSLALTAAYGHWKDPSFDYTAFVGRVMSLLFNTLSSFVIAFLPRSNCLLISCLQSPSTMLLEP